MHYEAMDFPIRDIGPTKPETSANLPTLSIRIDKSLEREVEAFGVLPNHFHRTSSVLALVRRNNPW
jgi:hypothetical protein